jgi:hypothetical protein
MFRDETRLRANMIEDRLICILKGLLFVFLFLCLLKLYAVENYLETLLLLLMFVFFLKVLLRTQGLF